MFKCLECSKEFVKPEGLSKHINLIHDGAQNYYVKWLKTNEEGFCKICGKSVKFKNITHGYENICSKECLFSFKYEKLKEGMIKKYGTHASVYVDTIKKKQEISCMEKYGALNPLASEKIQNKIKKTNIKKYGHENCLGGFEIRNKIKKTNLEKYGFENAAQNEDVKNKIKTSMMKNHGVNSYLEKTIEVQNGMLKKYGVKHSSQNRIIHEKQQMSAFNCKNYKDTNIFYRGSYELDFLAKYYDSFINLQTAPSIKYKYKSKNRVYHPDFYIPLLNLIVEIKNSYLAKRDKLIIQAKRKSVLEKGYQYIMIIDKDYSIFETLY